MRQKVLLCLVLLLSVGVAHGQISGKVTTADGQPAAYATVLLFADSNTSAAPVGYSLTTSEGHFTLDAEPATGHYLVVRHLGSAEWRRPLNGQREWNIRLVADVQTLDEVMVRSTYVPVQVHGDTIAFNTDYFRTGTEETAAEVIQQIPGMEVSESGEVSYAGKSVDKVLIDGKDMFASGSDGALNTLPADAIKGAELLMNYRSGSIIDQFSGREMTALNLKTDGRHRVVGRVGMEGGVRDKARADASLLYMGKTLSLTSILGANNTGDALFSLEDYIKTVVGLDNVLSSGGIGFNPSDEELRMMMPPSNVYASRNGLATLSGTWTPSSSFKMKGNLMLNGSGLEAQSLSLQQYLVFDALQQRRDNSHSRSLFVTGHLQETWKPTEKLEISNLTQLSRSRLLDTDSLYEEGLSDMFVLQHDTLGKQQIKEELVMNYRVSDKSLLSAHLTMGNTERNYTTFLLTDQQLLPMNYLRKSMDGVDWEVDTRRQVSELKVVPDISFAYNFTPALTLTTTAAYEHRQSAFRYNEGAIDERMGWNSMVGGLQLSKQRGLFRFSAGADVRRTSWTSTIEGLSDSAVVDLLPKVSVGLAFSETHRLTLSGEWRREPVEMEYLLRDTMVGGYSSLLAGSDITNPFAQSRNVQLNYHLFDLFTNTMFFVVAGMNDSRFSVRPHSEQTATILSSSRYDNDGSLAVRFVNASLRQGLGRWPLDVIVSAQLNQSTTQTAVNSLDSDMESLGYGGRVGLTSRRRKALNFEMGISLNKQHNSYTLTQNDLWEAEGHVALLAAWKNLSARVSFAYAHVEGNEVPRDLYDLGLRAEYRLKRWRFTLRGGNLLHLKEQQWITSSTTPLYLSTTTYRRLPGYLMMGVAYRF